MKLIGEQVKIAHGLRDEKDSKLEPEEQRVRHTQVVEVGASGVLDGKPVDLAAVIGEAAKSVGALHTDMPAHVATAELTRRCDLCAHWANQEWLRLKKELQGSEEGRKLLTQFKAALIANRDDALAAEDDSGLGEAVLSRGGVCKALSAIFTAQAPVVTIYDTAPCLQVGKGPGGEDCYDLFQPKRESRNIVTKAKDFILRKAQGR